MASGCPDATAGHSILVAFAPRHLAYKTVPAMFAAFITVQDVHDDGLLRPAESADGRLR